MSCWNVIRLQTKKKLTRDSNNVKAGSLLKRIIRKGQNVCRKAVSALESFEYDIHCNIQRIIEQQTGNVGQKLFCTLTNKVW